jgi:hypothetical protein
MKATLNGKRYDTDKCYTLAEHDYHNNGNYSGTASLIKASDGTLLVHTVTNGQDCWLTDNLCLLKDSDLKDDERLVELGLIVIVE